MKLCKRCEKYLPLDYFGSDKSRSSGKSIYCRKCRARLAKESRGAKPSVGRNYSRTKRYGITPEIFNDMLVRQENSCGICRAKNYDKLYIDHDHRTGKVRGLLCRDCNLLLGYAKDNPLFLDASIKYLKEWGIPSQQ